MNYRSGRRDGRLPGIESGSSELPDGDTGNDSRGVLRERSKDELLIPHPATWRGDISLIAMTCRTW